MTHTEILLSIGILTIGAIFIRGHIRNFLAARRADEDEILLTLSAHPNGLAEPALVKLSKLNLPRFAAAARRLERSRKLERYYKKLELVVGDWSRIRTYVLTAAGRQDANRPMRKNHA